MKTFREFFQDEETAASEDVVVFVPGSFKPPHKGHFEIAKDYVNDSSVDTVKILLGPTKRQSKDGSIIVGEEESRKI